MTDNYSIKEYALYKTTKSKAAYTTGMINPSDHTFMHCITYEPQGPAAVGYEQKVT